MGERFFIAALIWLCSFNAWADMNIAIIAPTSGSFKYFSEELINGAKVAVDEINENGGLKGEKVNLVQIDDPCDDTLSLTTAQMIAVNRSEEDKMYLVIGPQCGNQAEKIADIFSSAKIFQIHPTGSSRALYQTRYGGPMEMVGYIEQQAVDFFRYYAEIFADRKLAVVYDGSNLGMTEIAREIQHLFTKAGMGEKLTAFSPELYDHDPVKVFHAVKNSGARAVFMLSNEELTRETVRRLKKDDPEFVVFINRYFSGRSFSRKLSDAAEGIYVLALPSLTGNPEFAEDLVKLRLWGIEPEGLMAYGYLSVKLWRQLVIHTDSFAYDDIVKNMDNRLLSVGWGKVIYTGGIPDRSLKYAIYRYEKGEYTQVW